MNLPNKLTMLRILLIPVMLILYCIPALHRNYIFANVSVLYFIEMIIFVIASCTDFLDGNIARKRNLVTTFGKFADPLADKMLTFTAMAMFLADGHLNIIIFVVILIRELMVSGIRMVAADKQVVIAAGKSGKYKTAVTMVALIIMFFSGAHQGVAITAEVLMWIACILTIYSGIEYFIKAKDIIVESI